MHTEQVYCSNGPIVTVYIIVLIYPRLTLKLGDEANELGLKLTQIAFEDAVLMIREEGCASTSQDFDWTNLHESPLVAASGCLVLVSFSVQVHEGEGLHCQKCSPHVQDT
jgi:hypothetical protein